MTDHKKILLIIPGGISYTHRVGIGISSKVSQHESWIVQVAARDQNDFIHTFVPDGVIMNISTEISLQYAESVKGKVVNYSGVCDVHSMPTVRLDDNKIGAMAADYFLSLGLSNFSVFGHGQTSFSKLRSQGFISRLKDSGIQESRIFSFDVGRDNLYHSDYGKYVDLFKELPKPVGIFVKDDRCGCYLSNVARDAGVTVPNEIAILGVDNDQMYCNLAKPSLSSIATPAAQVGRVAVDLLAALLDGRDIPNEPVLLPPLGIIARGTTNMLAIDDCDLIEAIHFIRNHPNDGITVEDVLQEVPISRSSLERKFQQYFGRSPGDEIRRVKIEHVKNLLLNTDQTITEISQVCNYRDVQSLSSAFRRMTGQTPSDFRHQLQRSI